MCATNVSLVTLQDNVSIRCQVKWTALIPC